jgi:hypothetical protein
MYMLVAAAAGCCRDVAELREVLLQLVTQVVLALPLQDVQLLGLVRCLANARLHLQLQARDDRASEEPRKLSRRVARRSLPRARSLEPPSRHCTRCRRGHGPQWCALPASLETTHGTTHADKSGVRGGFAGPHRPEGTRRATRHRLLAGLSIREAPPRGPRRAPRYTQLPPAMAFRSAQ